MAIARLKPGHVQPLWAGHPWVFAQAIDDLRGGATAGDEVSVIDPRGNFIGRGLYSPGSAIPLRILVRDATTAIDGAFFEKRLARARALREELGLFADDRTTGFRLVHAEGDGMPGLIVDKLGDTLAVQFLTIGMKLRDRMIVQALEEVFRPKTLFDRTPTSVGKNEGFEPTPGLLAGDPLERFAFSERGFRYEVPTELGQKTGYYFDQRGLRARVEELAKGKTVLDAYSYVGPFALAAARGGASEVVAVDESILASEVGAECARANGLDDRIKFVRADARKFLKEAGEKGGYDLTIVDPPRLAPTRGSRDQALVAYSKLAELGARATKPGGLLVLCSCSAAVDLFALTRALANGALRANVQAFILERHTQGADHPVPAAFPEGLYLKALVAKIEPRS